MFGALQCPKRLIKIDDFTTFGARIDNELGVGIEQDCLAISIDRGGGVMKHVRFPWDQVLYKQLVPDWQKYFDSTYQQRIDFLDQIGACFVGQTNLGPAYTVYPCANPRT